MSQENVETVRRGIDAFNRRDVDLLGELTTADFEWFPALPGAVEADSYRGRAGMDTYFAQISGTWEELRILVDDVRDLGDGAVVLGRTAGRGRASGVELETPIGIVYEFRCGKLSRVHAYLDHDSALKAVGLED
jgi:ketosteroid isomerase-like protein